METTIVGIYAASIYETFYSLLFHGCLTQKGISWNNPKSTAQQEKSLFLRDSLLLPWVWLKHLYFPTLQKGSKMKGLMHAVASTRSLQSASNIFLLLSTLTSVRTLEAIWNLKTCLELKPPATLPNFLVQCDPAKYYFADVICYKTRQFCFFLHLKFQVLWITIQPSSLKSNKTILKTFPSILAG